MTHTDGAYNARIYLDGIDEALREKGKPGVRANRTMEALSQRYVAKCEKLLRQFERVIRKATRESEFWIPDGEFTKSMTDIGSEIRSTWKEMRAARKEEQEARKGLSDEQLDTVAISHLIRVAREMPLEHKRAVLTQWFGPKAAEKLMGLTP